MEDRADPWLESLIEVALLQVVEPDGAVTRSPFRVRDYMVWLARRAFEKGRETALSELMSSAEVAELLGVDRTTVFRRSVARGVGWRLGRDILYRPEDVRRLG